MCVTFSAFWLQRCLTCISMKWRWVSFLKALVSKTFLWSLTENTEFKVLFVKMKMKYTMQYYRILIIWICVIISSTNAADNVMPSTRLLPNLLGGPPLDSELLPKVFDFLQNYMTQNPDAIKPLDGLLGEQNNSVINELLKPLDDVFTGNASFRDALNEIFNSPVVQQLMNIGDMMTAGYLEGQGVSRSCYNDLKLSGSGIISGKDWALRSKYMYCLANLGSPPLVETRFGDCS